MSRDNDKSKSDHDEKLKAQRAAADHGGKDDGKGASGQSQKGRDASSKDHQAAKQADGKNQGKSGSK